MVSSLGGTQLRDDGAGGDELGELEHAILCVEPRLNRLDLPGGNARRSGWLYLFSSSASL